MVGFLATLSFTAVAESLASPIVDSSSLDEDVAAIYGSACEKIKAQEPKSSIRLRATDKASFDAVKNLPDLANFKTKANEHDFNVLVYNVVDNYVEDLAVRTTRQDDKEICVEVTGYVKKKDIAHAVVQNQVAENEAPKDLADDEKESLPDMTEEEIPQQAKPVNLKPETFSEPQVGRESLKTIDDRVQKPLLYIAPVEFFNNTTSDSHKQILKEVFDDNDYYYLTDNKETADYLINSKVMRAKVDPINSNTNRLQMVISVGVEFADSGASTVEHQNRFILFSSSDDEQEVAAKLMRKLLKKAGELILNKVEMNARKKAGDDNLPKIITPK